MALAHDVYGWFMSIAAIKSFIALAHYVYGWFMSIAAIKGFIALAPDFYNSVKWKVWKWLEKSLVQIMVAVQMGAPRHSA